MDACHRRALGIPTQKTVRFPPRVSCGNTGQASGAPLLHGDVLGPGPHG